MAYELNRNESVAENIRRIWSEELTAAINILENSGGEPDKAVHEVRKGIKKIRALLRLVRQAIGEELFRQENIRYRNIGHMLSHVREATVMIKTLDKLRGTNRKAIPRIAYQHTRKELLAKQADLSKIFFENTESIEAVLSALKEAQQNQPDVSVSEDSFNAFAINIEQIYVRGKKSYVYASKQPSIDSFHELRKEVKIQWYHTRLFKPLWPGLLEPYAAELGVLSELLGDDHDMGILYEEIKYGRLTFRRKATANRMLQLIENQRYNLQQQIHPLTKRIFAEKAKDYTTRLKLYWTIWRKDETTEQPV